MGFEIKDAAYGARDIYRGAQAVARIRGRTVELHGFWSLAEAERAVTTVSAALDRWHRWRRSWSGPSQHPTVGRLVAEGGILSFEITVPWDASADHMLQIARVALHAAFGRGTRYAESRAAA